MLESAKMEITSEEDYPQVLIEQTEFLTSAIQEIESLIGNISEFFKEFAKFSEKTNAEEVKIVKEYERYRDCLNDYIDHIHIEIPALVDVLKESEKQHLKYQKTIDELKMEIEDQKKQSSEIKQKYEEQLKMSNELKEKLESQKRVTDDLKETCDQVKEENTLSLTYSAAMGSVLAKMLWKTSKSQEAIETYIETGTMNQFLNLANNTIASFRNTYKNELPETETYEYKFILSLLGICINIMAQKIGREFVLEREIGQQFLNNVIAYLGDIPMPNDGGKLLKKLIVMLLYNLTFTKQGTLLIQCCEDSVDNIMKCFNADHTVEIQSISVQLMNMLLKNPQTNDFSTRVTKKLSQDEDDFKILMEKADSKTKEICTQFVNKLRELNDDISFEGDFS